MRTAAWLVLAILTGCEGRCGARREPAAAETFVDASADASVDASTGEGEAACTDRRADADERQRRYCAREGCRPEPPYEHEIADLDGDGVPERSFEIALPPVTAESHVYLGGARCVHLVTLPGGGEIERETTKKSEGYFDFRLVDHSVCEGARCGCSPTITYWRHENGAYREVKARHVEGTMKWCPDEE